MRVRFGFAICAAVVTLAAAPAAASACPSLRDVKGFSGTAYMGFKAQASGLIEAGQPQSGTETIHLDRRADVDINLTHKTVTRLGVVIFTGKAKGGSVHVADTFDDESGHSAYTFEGPLTNQLPNFGSAQLFLNPKTCKYQLTAVLFTGAKHSGGASGSDSVQATVYGDREHVPRSLKLSDGLVPDAYYGCPADPLQSGNACYGFSGGFATDFMTLFQCHSAQAENCSSSEGPAGDADFGWHLKPSYFQKKK